MATSDQEAVKVQNLKGAFLPFRVLELDVRPQKTLLNSAGSLSGVSTTMSGRH